MSATQRAALAWKTAVRIVKSIYPPIQLFERIADPGQWDALAALESRTNPRLRQEIGDISLVPPERRVGGPGSSVVMAAFTHPPPGGSRFTDGTYGCYYAAESVGTAVAETAFHLGRFYADSAESGGLHADMRVYAGGMRARLHDIRKGHDALHDPDSYSQSQKFARDLRDKGSDGLVYRSVRRPGGECVAAFWPDIVAIPSEKTHLTYHWDGRQIDRFFDYRTKVWKLVPGGAAHAAQRVTAKLPPRSF